MGGLGGPVVRSAGVTVGRGGPGLVGVAGPNDRLAGELIRALEMTEQDSNVRCVLLRGTGRGFCSGQDLGEIKERGSTPETVSTVIRERWNRLVLLLRNLNIPVVCAVHGVAAGAGANLALCCDIVVAAKSAYFVQAFVHVGLIPDTGGTYLLPRLVGFPRALAYAMLGEKVGAEEAERVGMIYRAVEDDDLAKASQEIATRLASMPTKAIALMKKAFNESLANSIEDQLQCELELQVEAASSHDHREGVAAFLEKRKPQYKGC